MKLLKYPLTLLLAAYILSFLVSRVYLSLTTPLTSVLAGICRLPGSSLIGLEFCDKMLTSQAKSRHVDYPKLMEIETQSFEKLLDNSISSTDLVFDLKKAEMVSADLNTVLLASDLPIKDHLSSAIRAFVDDARGTGRALQRFDAKVEGTIDQVTAFNDYVLHAITDYASSSTLSLPIRVMRSALLIPQQQENRLDELFDQVMVLLETHMARLLSEGQVVLSFLDRLDERLTAIHMLVAQEKDKASIAKQDLLAELWTILGGNRRRLAKYNSHIDLLKGIDMARQRALAHVISAVTTVEATQANLEDLRERASAPGLVGYDLPLEAHVLSIKSGIERIGVWRAKIGMEKGEAIAKLLGD